MTTREFIESLKLRDNIFELNEDTVVSYLIHFAAPFTGEEKFAFLQEQNSLLMVS